MTKAELDNVDRTDAVTFPSTDRVDVDFSTDSFWNDWVKDLEVCIEARYDAYPTVFIERCFNVRVMECES